MIQAVIKDSLHLVHAELQSLAEKNKLCKKVLHYTCLGAAGKAEAGPGVGGEAV